jgi:hypothetical protein
MNMKRDEEQIQLLIRKYREGKASDDDLLSIEYFVENDMLSLEDLDDVRIIERKIEQLETPAPSLELDTEFYRLLSKERAAFKSQREWFSRDWFSLEFLFPRLAFASVVFLAGLGIGYLVFSGRGQNADVNTLTMEVQSLREMMMLSMLERESATERLKAVSLTSELGESSAAVSEALIRTFNHDENVNVRLAALQALTPYCGDSKIREALIRSISLQESPLVQIALAELMVSLQEKSSVKEFEKILRDKKTPGAVKQQIQKNLQVLI